MHRDLVARHSEPWRAYHVLAHVEHCLDELDRVRELACDADAVEAALWFHDAVYVPGRADNEARSARLARETLAAGGADERRQDVVARLILATRHGAPAEGADERLIADVDLAILGADPARFDAYERDVRREYAAVPAPVFRARRAELLQGFLDRPQIYGTEPLRKRYEAAARRNLARSIAALGGASTVRGD